MKRWLVRAPLALLLSVHLAHAQEAPPAAGDGLVAHYTFEDCDPQGQVRTAADGSGQGNHGTMVGSVACAPGVRGGTALQFGGYDAHGYVTIPTSASLGFLDDYTFALWFNIRSFTSMDGWGQRSEYGLHALFAKAGDRNGIDLRTTRAPGEDQLRLNLFDGWCCFGGAGIGPTPTGVGLGEWHHAAVTSGGGWVRLYVDGVLQGELPTTVFRPNPSMAYMPLQLGIDQSAFWYPIDGSLDDVRVYRRALSAQEVAALYDGTAPSTTVSLAGTQGNDGWYTSAVTVTLAAADDPGGSGVARIEYSLDGGASWTPYAGPFAVGAEGAVTVLARAVDRAGNVEAPPASASARIDLTPPASAIVTPANGVEYTLGEQVAADWSSSDAVSGLCAASATAAQGQPVDTSTVGQHGFAVNAADCAGNAQSIASFYSVRYAFGGFLPPVAADGSSVFRVPAVVRVAFQLRDAAGAAVPTAGATLSIAPLAGGTPGPAQPAPSATASGMNAFRYDPVDQLYVFNLATRGLAAGTYQLSATLDDGSERVAVITLR